MTPKTTLENGHFIYIESLTHEIAARVGIKVRRVKLVDGLPIGCVDAHLLAFVHESKNHYVLLHHDLSNARNKISEALSKIKAQVEQ